MVQNIAIVGLDRKKAYEVAKTLAEELDLFFFDALELFEFDNLPRTFPSMLKEFGENYYRRKEKGIIGYASEFTNCVINLEGGFCENLDNIKKIKESSLLVYLAEAPNIVKEDVEKREFFNQEERNFFVVSEEVLKQRASLIENSADVIVNASSGSSLKIASETIRMIKNYYTK